MKKHDDYIANKKNYQLNQMIANSPLNPLDNNSHYIQSYKEKKYSSQFNNNYYIQNQKTLSKTNNKKNNYPYYFDYSDYKIKDFLKYEKNNYNISPDNSQVTYRNITKNLNWYEIFKNSNFYKLENSFEVKSKKNIKENNDEYFLQKEINEIANSFKILNNNFNNNKYTFGPYLFKNKYSELF